MSFVLRDYQRDLVERIRAEWGCGTTSVLATLPTGGGKSEIAIELLQEATPSNRALVVVDRKTLCHQWVARTQRHAPGAVVGILQADNTSRIYAPIIVGTAQTIRSRGVPEDVGLIVIDESHIVHAAHDTVVVSSPGAKVLGLTATPLREGLGLRFQKLLVGATIKELIAQGHLVQPRYFAPKHSAIETALESVSIRAGDYASNELSRAMRTKAIIGDVVGSWQQRGENRQTIGFCVDKQHARDLADEFVAAGVRAAAILDETEDDERARLFSDFDAGRLRVLCSVGVLSVGFDSPVASCAILARPTLSLSLHIQQGGRVLRPFEGKADAIVLDHAANTLRHGLLEDFEPPKDLSQIDKKVDKKSRKEKAEAWVCKHCEAVNALHDDICSECGNPRRRVSTVFVVDGELVPLEADDPLAAGAPTHAQIRNFYLECTYYGASKGFSNPPSWAFYRTLDKFKLERDSKVIAWHWRDLEPIPTTAETARWLLAQWRRQVIARKYGGGRPTA